MSTAVTNWQRSSGPSRCRQYRSQRVLTYRLVSFRRPAASSRVIRTRSSIDIIHLQLKIQYSFQTVPTRSERITCNLSPPFGLVYVLVLVRVVTSTSDGIGREFASQLAWRALTIVARSLVELDVVMI